MTGALILIVEDNDKNLKLARDLLQHHGFRTLEADTAAAGIALAEDHVPDLILMDIQLPDMDGVTALGRLRGSVATTSIPVALPRSPWLRTGSGSRPPARRLPRRPSTSTTSWTARQYAEST